MNLQRLRVAVVAAGALGLGALAAGAAGTAATLPPVDPSGGFDPVAFGSLRPSVAIDDALAAPAADSSVSALAGPRRRPALRESANADVDARYLATPLAERFTQTTPGAVNPGMRRGGADAPMTGMLAAVLHEDAAPASTAGTLPPVDPPPPPGGEDDDDDDDGGGDNGGGGDTCDPLDGDCVVEGGGGGPTGVPEIDGDLFGAGLLLLVGGALVLSSRRRPEVAAV